MLMPSIFGEDLFEDLFDLPFYDDSKVEKKLYGRHAKNLMKTDIKEMDNGYELIIDLPGFKKDEIKVSLDNGYLSIAAAKGLDQDEQEKRFKKLEKKKETQWRVTQGDKERNVKYDEYALMAEEMHTRHI